MEQLIITEDIVDGILWIFIVGGGLFVVFILVALLMLCFYSPKCSPYMKEGSHDHKSAA